MREEDPHSAVLKQQKSSFLDMDMDDDKIMVKNICFIGAGHVGKFNTLFNTLSLCSSCPNLPLTQREQGK